MTREEEYQKRQETLRKISDAHPDAWELWMKDAWFHNFVELILWGADPLWCLAEMCKQQAIYTKTVEKELLCKPFPFPLPENITSFKMETPDGNLKYNANVRVPTSAKEINITIKSNNHE